MLSGKFKEPVTLTDPVNACVSVISSPNMFEPVAKDID